MLGRTLCCRCLGIRNMRTRGPVCSWCTGPSGLHPIGFLGPAPRRNPPLTRYHPEPPRFPTSQAICRGCATLSTRPSPALPGGAGRGGGSHRDTFFHVFLVEEGVVDPQHDPVEQGAVQGLGHGVAGSDGLWARSRVLYLDEVGPGPHHAEVCTRWKIQDVAINAQLFRHASCHFTHLSQRGLPEARREL